MAEQPCEDDVPLPNHTPYREDIVIGEEGTAAAASRFYVLELLGDMLSPGVRRVVVVLRYHHIPFTFVEVDMSKGEHKSPSFVRLNPNQDVPVLLEKTFLGSTFASSKLDDSFVLWESHAIIRYIARVFLPSDGKEATSTAGPNSSEYHAIAKLQEGCPRRLALQDQWLDWTQGVLRKGVSQFIRSYWWARVWRGLKRINKKNVYESYTSVTGALDVMEGVLSSHDHSTRSTRQSTWLIGPGPAPSVADLSAACELSQAFITGAWNAEVAKRPCVQRWFMAVARHYHPWFDETQMKMKSVVDRAMKGELQRSTMPRKHDLMDIVREMSKA